jgi:hypothetical protein
VFPLPPADRGTSGRSGGACSALEDLTNDPGWAVLKKPEYAQHSNTFREAVRALHSAASKRDLDGTPKAYIAMTLSCVDCHRYLARSRFARE